MEDNCNCKRCIELEKTIEDYKRDIATLQLEMENFRKRLELENRITKLKADESALTMELYAGDSEIWKRLCNLNKFMNDYFKIQKARDKENSNKILVRYVSDMSSMIKTSDDKDE